MRSPCPETGHRMYAYCGNPVLARCDLTRLPLPVCLRNDLILRTPMSRDLWPMSPEGRKKSTRCQSCFLLEALRSTVWNLQPQLSETLSRRQRLRPLFIALRGKPLSHCYLSYLEHSCDRFHRLGVLGSVFSVFAAQISSHQPKSPLIILPSQVAQFCLSPEIF